MKIKTAICIYCLVILNSCIVKSLQPFYVPEAIAFQEAFIGEWNDNKSGNWKVTSLKEEFEEDKDLSELSTEDREAFEKYKDGYLITYTKNEKESVFMAMPFKIDDQVFIDFIPFEYEGAYSNNLVDQHLLKTHSVAKLDIIEKNQVKVNWLDEERLKELFNNNQIQLKHEVIGLDESFILTASSEELYRFLKKYMASDLKNKWETSQKFTLQKVNDQP